MTVGDVLRAVESGELRKDVENHNATLGLLLAHLCYISQSQLKHFNKGWHYKKQKTALVGVEPSEAKKKADIEEFMVALDKEIITCISIEMSGKGSAIRKGLGLPILALGTIIDTPPPKPQSVAEKIKDEAEAKTPKPPPKKDSN